MNIYPWFCSGLSSGFDWNYPFSLDYLSCFVPCIYIQFHLGPPFCLKWLNCLWISLVFPYLADFNASHTVGIYTMRKESKLFSYKFHIIIFKRVSMHKHFSTHLSKYDSSLDFESIEKMGTLKEQTWKVILQILMHPTQWASIPWEKNQNYFPTSFILLFSRECQCTNIFPPTYPNMTVPWILNPLKKWAPSKSKHEKF